jgi:hypothetical protein
MNLLSKGSTNAKLAKNERESFIMYLSPFTNNSKGINLCIGATEECVLACLYDSGFASVYASVNEARQRRTEFYINSKKEFMVQLAKEINEFILNADGKEVLFRLNGTSDLDFLAMLKMYADFDFMKTPDNVFFYDYTKIFGKIKKYGQCSEKYKQTFSFSGSNTEQCLEALKLGNNVAMVYKGTMPSVWNGFEVVNGDVSDEEMFKYKSKVLGLKLKGNKQKKIKTSNFVLDVY